MKDKIKQINLKGKNYTLAFNLNVMADVQDKFKDLDSWMNAMTSTDSYNISTIRWTLMAMINEGIEIENEGNEEQKPLMTEREVGRLIDAFDSDTIKSIFSVVTESTTSNDDKEDKELVVPNEQTTQENL